MKRIINNLIFFFLHFSLFHSEIKNFEAIIQEKDDNKVMEYILRVSFPSRLYKEITIPSNKKGEIYIINEDKKIIFYPSINYISEEKIDKEDILLKVLKDIKDFSNIKVNNRTTFLKKRNVILEFKDKKLYLIKYPDNTKILLKNYILKDDIFFPFELEIFSKNEKNINIHIKEMKFNIDFKDNDFNIRK